MSNYYTVTVLYMHKAGLLHCLYSNSTNDLNCGELMLSHMPALYSSIMKGHECQLRTLQATALFQSTLQSHLIFFGKLESVPCCPTLHGDYFHVPCMVLSLSTRKAQLIPKYQTSQLSTKFLLEIKLLGTHVIAMCSALRI